MTAVKGSEKKLAEGKTKILFEGNSPNEVRVVFKNAATAFNGGKYAEFESKGSLNARISALLFDLLAQFEVPTCFVKRGSAENELIYTSLTMIPLEVVIRNAAFGSLCKRFGIAEGTDLAQPVLEFFYKDNNAGDPQIGEDVIGVLKLVRSGEDLEQLKRLTYQVNEIFVAYFNQLGIRCADFKLEFGYDTDGKLRLGDELSPDNFRFRDAKTGQALDKDVFRFDLGDLEAAYNQLHDRMIQGAFASDKAFTTRTYPVQLTVQSRSNILSPESKTILSSLQALGYQSVTALRAGKSFEIQVQARTMLEAEKQLQTIGEKVLSNPVIEDFSFTIGLPTA